MTARDTCDIEPLADDGWLLRFGERLDPDLNARVHAMAARIRAHGAPWLRDLVPAFASLGVFFDPAFDPARVHETLQALADDEADAGSAHARDVRTVEIPVVYGGESGPDLESAAAELGLSSQQLVERHSAGDYTVAMIGFAPGFPYLSGLEAPLALPRLATPRARVAAGSVAIGGAQTGIYPRESPGGWRLLGRTSLPLFDPALDPPSLLQPGDRVRFVAVDSAEAPPAPTVAKGPRPSRVVHVIRPGLLTTVQDAGRSGWRHVGVAHAGALDADTAALANRLVGNAPDAAVLEMTLRGPTLQFDTPVRIALLGAAVSARFDGAAVPMGRPVDLPAGTLELGSVRGGARAWLAIAGGIAVATVLGSRSTDLRGGFGGLEGRALTAGDTLPLGDAPIPSGALPRAPAWWIDPMHDESLHAPIRYLPSAHPAASALARRKWQVSNSSNRQGLRLQGEALPAPPADGVSEPVAPGTIQLPPDGQPILLLADAQTVGGYPKLGHVIAADLPRLAQCIPGQWLHFAPCDAATARRLACAARARLARIALMIDARPATV
ncbi:5-oxoprolinase subunit PxpB [Lysobacter sp. LF1]|uniref:5-oxoprolinase subunit PxpB n=1 Tax=Lysobacter stagni TaxID=3045172 RepID=A0ABT6XJJ5_9GAMM|nr:5-oxoprolinase subunit PxpB [Lysobacter sp. LF1]MDI9240330.1 5-oxoprolinase subunit PxpB [Lysobacter sp. LF1]